MSLREDSPPWAPVSRREALTSLPLEDREAIAALIFEHGAAFDEGRAARAGELYTAEGELRTGIRLLKGRAAISAHGAGRDADPIRKTRHLVTNLRLFALDGDEGGRRAGAVSTGLVIESFADREAPPALGLVVEYHDLFRLTPEGWLFEIREVRRFGAAPGPELQTTGASS